LTTNILNHCRYNLLKYPLMDNECNCLVDAEKESPYIDYTDQSIPACKSIPEIKENIVSDTENKYDYATINFENPSEGISAFAGNEDDMVHTGIPEGWHICPKDDKNIESIIQSGNKFGTNCIMTGKYGDYNLIDTDPDNNIACENNLNLDMETFKYTDCITTNSNYKLVNICIRRQHLDDCFDDENVIWLSKTGNEPIQVSKQIDFTDERSGMSDYYHKFQANSNSENHIVFNRITKDTYFCLKNDNQIKTFQSNFAYGIWTNIFQPVSLVHRYKKIESNEATCIGPIKKRSIFYYDGIKYSPTCVVPTTRRFRN